MTTPRSLPARPSLDSLRKQAKKLARDRSLSLRDAQFAIAREYGYPGWRDLSREVSRRLGNEVDWAADEARRVIHDDDVERLKYLLSEHPALLRWQGGPDGAGLLGIATGAYGDSFDSTREQYFTRAACAELLIDAGAVVTPPVIAGLVQSRARGLLQLFRRKGLLPRTLPMLSALGDLAGVRAALDEGEHDIAAVEDAFLCACRFQHVEIAALLLDRLIALDAELGKRIDGGSGRPAFIRYFVEKAPGFAKTVGPWRAFLAGRVRDVLHDGDLMTFARGLHREAWLLGDPYVWFQTDLIEVAALNDRGEFIAALFDLDPAILRRQPPPPSQAIEFAFTYGHTHLLPLLSRIWPVPDDLPHAAGLGNLPRVKQWFDESGAPALGDLDGHYPCNDPRARSHLHWDLPAAQQVLDVALAFSVVNRRFDVADFLLSHGADINTDWNSHEPASILHHLVFLRAPYDSMQFLIDRGIDMTIRDYRWNSTAQGWAAYALHDQKLADWLRDAERARG